MSLQRYVFALLMAFLWAQVSVAQCLSLPNAVEEIFAGAEKILEGKVVGQETFIGEDGNIYTRNHFNVYRILKGTAEITVDVVTEGGIYGDLMQVVTPSTQMQVGDYGLIALADDQNRSLVAVADAFYPINEKNNSVYGLKNITDREALYEMVARSTGSNLIQMVRVPDSVLNPESVSADRDIPFIESVFPLDVTAGTQTVLTIKGEGFGAEQGEGLVAFRNADDGGQSFVEAAQGPHYLSWSDTLIEMYVPSTALYNTMVAGTGTIQVVSHDGDLIESTQYLTVDYAKSEVIYSEQLSNTVLVGMQNGGYVFHVNQQLNGLAGGPQMAINSVEKWACNTGINFSVAEEQVTFANWAHDGINLLGLSAPQQLPSYLLGKTVTTFSGCGTPNGLQWNLIEVDILLNRDINWWITDGNPMTGYFDLATAILHELGHAHLLQHNNNPNSPMYFQLTSGAMRRDLHQLADVDGGDYVTTESVETVSTCGDEAHTYYDFSQCNLSVINGISNEESEDLSVYPNPFLDQITIVRQSGPVEVITVIDVAGKEVYSCFISGPQNTISLGHLSSGIYTLRFGDAQQPVRLVKN